MPDCLKESFFNFLISSGLSITSFSHVQKVIRSLEIGEKVLKIIIKSDCVCMNPTYVKNWLFDDRIEPRKSCMDITLSHEQPSLVNEFYKLVITVKNKEATTIKNVQ